MEKKNENTTDIEVSEVIQPTVMTLDSEQLVELAEKAEKRVKALSKIKTAALLMTTKNDWVDQNGKPYLQVSGAEKIGMLFGIGWTLDGGKLETEDGGHFRYVYRGEFTFAGNKIEAIGSRSSRDGFFTKYTYEKVEGQQDKKTALPPSELDKGDIQKSAFTNCIGNGITRVLGMRNLTWDDVSSVTKITQDMVSGVSYGGKSQKASTKVGQNQNMNSPATEKQCFKVDSMAREIHKCENGEAVLALCKTLLGGGEWLDDVERVEGFTRKSASELITLLGAKK